MKGLALIGIFSTLVVKIGYVSMERVAKLLLALIVLGFAVVGLAGCSELSLGMLNPKGLIAYEERKLFFDTLALMLIVVLPVIIMSFAFAYHYQASHRIRDYKPNWSHSYFLEVLWWGIPCAIILVLAILTWKKTYELDPYHKIPGHDEKPLLVQAIALPWKWLFIYPEENIATVNYLVVPTGRQVEYWITADNVPMSAFFVPQLGSQIFAMTGMRTRLHLLSNQPGVYEGLNTQYNGDGFSDMHFPVYVVDAAGMQKWVDGVKQSTKQLNDASYSELLNPSEGNRPQFFAGVPPDFFNNVIMTYMHTFGPIHPRSAHNNFDHAVKVQGE
ncbi:MAG: COX aromatic rich motif-containing protein [Gammaproteobacteria bacterium]